MHYHYFGALDRYISNGLALVRKAAYGGNAEGYLDSTLVYDDVNDKPRRSKWTSSCFNTLYYYIVAFIAYLISGAVGENYAARPPSLRHSLVFHFLV